MLRRLLSPHFTRARSPHGGDEEGAGCGKGGGRGEKRRVAEDASLEPPTDAVLSAAASANWNMDLMLMRHTHAHCFHCDAGAWCLEKLAGLTLNCFLLETPHSGRSIYIYAYIHVLQCIILSSLLYA